MTKYVRMGSFIMTMAVAAQSSYSKAESWKMFDKISGRYDLLNRVLSFWLDVGWRRRIADYLPQKNGIKLLDLATGTGDVLLSIFEQGDSVSEAYGIDMAEEMLTIGRRKVSRKNLSGKIRLEKGDVNRVPFPEGSFDAVTIAYGIRNVEDPGIVLAEMFRVLKKGGRALVLEFSRPKNKVLKAFHTLYLRSVVPFLGALLAGDFKAYRYLNTTIENFPYGGEFCRLMEKAGFAAVAANPLTFGAATIYQGDKPL